MTAVVAPAEIATCPVCATSGPSRRVRLREMMFGTVVVRTPVMGTALWRRYGSDWWELDPPRHLFVFSADALVRLADTAGLELETVVHESSGKEWIGSEQYRRDLAMFEPGSWFVDPAASWVTREQRAEFEAAARDANANGEGGRACFRFRATAGARGQ